MARSISKSRRYAVQYTLPGLWEQKRDHYLKMIEDGDPRIAHDFAGRPRLTDAERAAYNASPHSGPSAARAELARMDEQGWFETRSPSPRGCPDAAAVPWLADGSVRRVRVYAGDHIEPVPD